MWMLVTPAGGIFIFHQQLAQFVWTTALCLHASAPWDCRAWPLFSPSVHPFPCQGRFLLHVSQQFQPADFLRWDLFVHLWLLSYQGALWLYFCICPSVAVRSRNVILIKRYDFCLMIWRQWPGMANKNTKPSWSCTSLFFPSTVLMCRHVPQPSSKKQGIYWEAFLPPAHLIAVWALALPVRLSKSKTRKAKQPQSVLAQPQPALASLTCFSLRPPTITIITILAGGGEGDKARSAMPHYASLDHFSCLGCS